MANTILRAQRVETIFLNCLFKEDEPKEGYEEIELPTMTVGFHPTRIENHKIEIGKLLNQLPTAFREGGHSFLAACDDHNGVQWAAHRHIEQLLALGLATNQVRYCMPRNMWSVLPGGMPYFAVIQHKN